MIPARKERIKALFRLGLLFAILIWSSEAFGHPLRIWVMPNGPGIERSDFTATEIQSTIDRLKNDHGIIIENSVRDLLMPSGVDNAYPLASYVLEKNELIDQIRKFKGIKAEKEPVAVRFIRWSNAFNRIMSAKNSSLEEMPDIIQIGSTWVASFAAEDAIWDVSERFDESKFFEPAIKSAKPHNLEGLYAVPWFLDARLVFYWKNMIPENSFSSFESFRQNCFEVLARNPDIRGVIGFPTAMTWDLLHNLAPWLWAQGGDIIRARTVGPLSIHKVLLDEKNSLETFAYLRELSTSGCAAFEDTNVETMETHFLSKKLASIVTGPWFLTRLPRGWEEKIGITLPPAGKDGSHPFIGGSHLAVWFGAKKRGNFDSAVALIGHLTNPDAQKSYAQVTAFLPARKEALDQWLTLPYMDVFRKALDNGRSYPAIPEWGSVVENEFIRNHLWQIWTGISQGLPMHTLELTVKNASNALRKKIAQNVWDENRLNALLAAGSMILIGGLLIVRSRRRSRLLEVELSKTQDELRFIEGEKTAMEGRLLFLDRKEKQHIGEVLQLKGKLRRLNDHSQTLAKRIALMQTRQRSAVKPKLGKVEVKWDGRLRVNGSEIKFENTNQAMKLIDHITRQSANGVTTVSCLWGYVLFDWDPSRLQSMPNRLFNTAVSKINSSLTGSGRPPLLKSEGRKSWRWRFLWDADLLLKDSDICLALAQVAKARNAMAEGDIKQANNYAVSALQIDPKCMDALNILCTIEPSDTGSELKSRIRQVMLSEIKSLEAGLEAIGQLSKNGKEVEEYRELLEQEAIAMRHRAGYLKRCMDGVFAGAKTAEQPLHLTDILCRLSSIQSEITNLKASGIQNKSVWAAIVQSENFMGLLSIPRIQSIVNRFYNHETKTMEDPRLVQLALVLMLSQPDRLSAFETAKTDDEFFGFFTKELQKQFRILEQEISFLPQH